MAHGGQEPGSSRYPVELLQSITERAASRPWLSLSLSLGAAVAALAATLAWIEFRTDRSDLIDPSEEFHRRWTEYADAFGDRSDLVVVLESDDTESIKAAVEELADRMRNEPQHFSHILYRIEPDSLRRKGLQYLSPEQLEAGLQKLRTFRPVLDGHWERLRLDLLVRGLQFQLQGHLNSSDTSDSNGLSSAEIRETLTHIDRLTESLDGFLRTRGFTNPWPELLDVDADRRGQGQEVIYLMNEAGTIGFLKARPVVKEQGFEGATVSIDRLREVIQEVASSHRDVQIGLTGIPVLESDEMRRSQADMTNASIVSFLLVGLLLFVGFRGVRHPLIALLALAAAVCWTFGYTTIAIGHLNILSVSFAAILIGLGIDFSIHYLARYLELREQESSLPDSLTGSSCSVGAGIVTAAITTSVAFFCASFTEFLGVAELGIISGGGVLLCAVATFVILPATITLADSGRDPRRLPHQIQALGFRKLIASWPGLAGVVSTALIVAAGCQALEFQDSRIRSRVAYDYNLLNLQAEGLESVEIQHRISSGSSRSERPDQGSLLFAVSIADSAEEARRLRDAYLRLPTVHHVEELGSRLPLYPPEHTQLLVQAFDAQLAGLPDELPPASPVNPIDVGESLEQLLEVLRPLDHPLARQSSASIDRFLDALDAVELDDQYRRLMGFQQRMSGALLAQLRSVREAGDPKPVTRHDLPAELAARFISQDGRWLVQIYPSEPVWDLEPLTRFVNDCRSIDPDVTGTPLQNFEASRQIMRSYQNAALYALASVSFVLLIDLLGVRLGARVLVPSALMTLVIAVGQHFSGNGIDYRILMASFLSLVGSLALVIDARAVLFVLLTLLPPVAGSFLLFGMLSLLHVDLNPANLIVLPLILGIGVDDGVHVVHDFREQRGSYLMSGSTMNAIVLTSLTSMIGFGSMMLAAHRGLFSLGLVLVLGVGSCLFVSLIPLPALLSLVRRFSGANAPSQAV